MKLSRQDLYRIILEEYLKEEGLTESKAALDLLRRIKGDPDYDPRQEPGSSMYDPDFKGDDETVADVREPADETYPMDKPLRAEMSQDEVVSAIGELIHGKGPDEVSEIFELVYTQIPGVEIGAPEEELPPSPYSGKAIAQRQFQQGQRRTGFEESFALGELMELIKEVLSEEYSGEESYDEWIDTLLSRLTDHYGMNIDHEEQLPRDLDYRQAHAKGACPHATADQVAKEY